MALKLGIGTAQFGMDYGISNQAGQSTPEEIANILALAANRGVRLIDTAPTYGNSEVMLGAALPANRNFDVVTKTPVYSGREIGLAECTELQDTFARTLTRLGVPSVYGLLVHHAEDLLVASGARLFDEMTALKSQRQVSKIGASVYTADQIEQLCQRYPIDMIQVPVSIFDQRLIAGGQLGKLRRAGIEIHVRSVFLQGLVLMPPNAAPAFFDPIRPRLLEFHAAAKVCDTTPMQLALNFIQQLAGIDGIIIGVCSANELSQILDILDDEPSRDLDYTRFAINDERMINPTYWH